MVIFQEIIVECVLQCQPGGLDYVARNAGSGPFGMAVAASDEDADFCLCAKVGIENADFVVDEFDVSDSRVVAAEGFSQSAV